jgi:hypothetical protein
MVDHHDVDRAIAVVIDVGGAPAIAFEIDPCDVGDIGEPLAVEIVAEQVVMLVTVPGIVADKFRLPVIAFQVGRGGRNCAPE